MPNYPVYRSTWANKAIPGEDVVVWAVVTLFESIFSVHIVLFPLLFVRKHLQINSPSVTDQPNSVMFLLMFLTACGDFNMSDAQPWCHQQLSVKCELLITDLVRCPNFCAYHNYCSEVPKLKHSTADFLQHWTKCCTCIYIFKSKYVALQNTSYTDKVLYYSIMLILKGL